MDRTVNILWYCNERRHGKRPMDGVGGTIKKQVYRDVMSNKCVIKSAEEFSNHAKVVNGMTSFYLPEADYLTKPDDTEEAPKITEMSIHMLVRNFNKDSICLIQFFNLTADLEPYFTQFYRMDGEPEHCCHELLPLLFDTDEICDFCKGHYKGKVEWLQCNIYEK